MGFAVGQSQNSLGAPAISLFLFDRATAGAGFAVSFVHLMRQVISRTEQILDCKNPGCEKACAACVLTSDAPDGKDELNRAEALEFLRAHLVFREKLNLDDCFVDSAELSLAPLDEIHFELIRSAGSTLTVFLHDQSSPAAMEEWPLAAQLQDWKNRGHQCWFALGPGLIKRLSAAEKLAVRDFALRHNVGLVTAEPPTFTNGSSAIAMITKKEEARHIWASRELQPRLPGPLWGVPIEYPVTQGHASIDYQFARVNLDMLLPPQGAHLIQLSSELNCDLATFGARASKIIVELLKKCDCWSTAGIAQATYQDSYVSSPLVARHLIDTISQLFSQAGSDDATLIIETRAPRGNDQRSQPRQLGHDWRSANDQKDVMEMLGKQRRTRVLVRHTEVPHGRYLRMNFADGSRATVLLDQGIGAWMPPRNIPIYFDFGSDVASQVKRLVSLNATVQRRGVGNTYLVAAPT